MKIETLIYEKIKKIIPDNSENTIFFVYLDENSYEIFFYAYIDGMYHQCFNLSEQGIIDENKLDAVFEAVALLVRESRFFKIDKRNIATIKVDKNGVNFDIMYTEKNDRLYNIKKEWINENIK